MSNAITLGDKAQTITLIKNVADSPSGMETAFNSCPPRGIGAASAAAPTSASAAK